jgi:hypothetical protein
MKKITKNEINYLILLDIFPVLCHISASNFSLEGIWDTNELIII